MNRCQAESYCKAFNEERSNCHDLCIGYVQMQNIYELSKMPKKYQFGFQLDKPGRDRESFMQLKNWELNAKENVIDGKGLILYSPTKGNGKTSWACKLMNAYFKGVALNNNMRCRGLFVSVPQFFRDMRDHIRTPSEEMEEKLKNIITADLVIWDDIGCESPTNWVRENLYIFINHREQNNLSQIYTSNVHMEQLKKEQYLGERIVSRMLGQCDLYEFVEEVDRRLHK